MSTPEERRVEERLRRTERQRQRRMDQRGCGNRRCGRHADTMIDWGGQIIPICRPCERKLEAVEGVALCSFDEVSPVAVRPPAVVSGYSNEVADPAAEQGQGRSFISRMFSRNG